MTDELAACFDKLIRGECSPHALERELLGLCRSGPDRAWQSLAVLDRYYRQRKIPEALCRTLRQRIGAQAMRLEGQFVMSTATPPLTPVPTAAATPVPHPVEMQPPRTDAPERPIHAAAQSSCDTPSIGTAQEHALLSRPRSLRPAQRGSASPAVTADPVEAVKLPAGRERAARPATAASGRRVLSGAADSIAAPQPARRSRWRRGFQTSPAIGLLIVVLGVAASTKVQDPPESIHERTPPVSEIAPPAPAVDPAPAVLSLSSDRYVVYPHQKMLEFSVERSETDSGGTSFRWWTQAAGAKSSEDYIGTRGKVVDMPEGARSVTLQVPILSNPQRRHIEYFYVVIGTENGSVLGTIHRATVFVVPDSLN